MLAPLTLTELVVWGVVVGVDFVTMPQALLSRPLVAATVAGWLAGNIESGLVAGITLELYALDVLPIGASWYPEYGVAAVAGGTAAALVAPALAPGVAGLVALPLALLGGWSILQLRRRNALALARRMERVSAGDSSALGELQHGGMLRDMARALIVAVIGIAVALVVATVPWETRTHAAWLSYAAVAGGLAAAFGGAVRSAGMGSRRHWLAAGLVTGLAVAFLQ
jgi:mannose/fructose/N-acetylgalactosamine-specific phosphotransferase system component IIC